LSCLWAWSFFGLGGPPPFAGELGRGPGCEVRGNFIFAVNGWRRPGLGPWKGWAIFQAFVGARTPVGSDNSDPSRRHSSPPGWAASGERAGVPVRFFARHRNSKSGRGARGPPFLGFLQSAGPLPNITRPDFCQAPSIFRRRRCIPIAEVCCWAVPGRLWGKFGRPNVASIYGRVVSGAPCIDPGAGAIGSYHWAGGISGFGLFPGGRFWRVHEVIAGCTTAQGLKNFGGAARPGRAFGRGGINRAGGTSVGRRQHSEPGGPGRRTITGVSARSAPPRSIAKNRPADKSAAGSQRPFHSGL